MVRAFSAASSVKIVFSVTADFAGASVLAISA